MSELFEPGSVAGLCLVTLAIMLVMELLWPKKSPLKALFYLALCVVVIGCVLWKHAL